MKTLEKKIQDIVDNAVNSNSYHELSHTINQTVNKAIDSGSEALKNAMNSVFDPGADPEFRKKAIHIRVLITEEAESKAAGCKKTDGIDSTERLPVRISKA